MRRLLATVLFWTSLLVSGVLVGVTVSVVSLFVIWFDSRRKWYSLCACTWSWLTLMPLRLLGLWRVRVVNRPERHGGCLYVANHVSQLDILLIHSTYLHARWVSKRSVFYVPVVGWTMLLGGYIPLKRDDAGSIRAMMRRCAELLREGNSVVVFPEGTRSPDGEMRGFKKGAFVIAKDAGVAVVPVLIRGTNAALPRGSWMAAGKCDLSVEYLAPIGAEVVAAQDAEATLAQARAAIAAAQARA